MSSFAIEMAIGGGLALMLVWTLVGGPGAAGLRVHELWQQRARMLLPFVILYLALLLAGHYLL